MTRGSLDLALYCYVVYYFTPINMFMFFFLQNFDYILTLHNIDLFYYKSYLFSIILKIAFRLVNTIHPFSNLSYVVFFLQFRFEN